MNNFKDEVIALIEAFIAQNGKNPIKLFITPEKENEMYKLPNKDIGNKVSGLTVNGPRKTFENKNFLGLKIIWDSDEFKVEWNLKTIFVQVFQFSPDRLFR